MSGCVPAVNLWVSESVGPLIAAPKEIMRVFGDCAERRDMISLTRASKLGIGE